jgi:hypothetical protein
MFTKILPCLHAHYFLQVHTDAPMSVVQKVDTVLLRAHCWPASAMPRSRHGQCYTCSALSQGGQVISRHSGFSHLGEQTSESKVCQNKTSNARSWHGPQDQVVSSEGII